MKKAEFLGVAAEGEADEEQRKEEPLQPVKSRKVTKTQAQWELEQSRASADTEKTSLIHSRVSWPRLRLSCQNSH